MRAIYLWGLRFCTEGIIVFYFYLSVSLSLSLHSSQLLLLPARFVSDYYVQFVPNVTEDRPYDMRIVKSKTFPERNNMQISLLNKLPNIENIQPDNFEPNSHDDLMAYVKDLKV